MPSFIYSKLLCLRNHINPRAHKNEFHPSSQGPSNGTGGKGWTQKLSYKQVGYNQLESKTSTVRIGGKKSLLSVKIKNWSFGRIWSRVWGRPRILKDGDLGEGDRETEDIPSGRNRLNKEEREHRLYLAQVCLPKEVWESCDRRLKL